MQPSYIFTLISMAAAAATALNASPPYAPPSLIFTPKPAASTIQTLALRDSSTSSIIIIIPAAAPSPSTFLFRRVNATTTNALAGTAAPNVEVSPLPLSTLNITVDFATFTAPPATTGVATSPAFPVKNRTTTVTMRNIVTATAIKTATVTAGAAKKTGSAVLPNASNVRTSIPALGAGTGAATEDPAGKSEAGREGGSRGKAVSTGLVAVLVSMCMF